MTSSANDHRSRVLVAAAEMIRRRGLRATSIRELAKHAEAPLGSTYHYFPGGKQQVATEAIQLSASQVSGVLRRQLGAGPAEGLQALLQHWRGLLVDSDFQAGCPILAVSVEDDPEGEFPDVRSAAAEAFADWQRPIAASLRRHGVGRAQADRLATLIIAAAEGAIALCRAQQSPKPLDRVATELDRLIRITIDASS